MKLYNTTILQEVGTPNPLAVDLKYGDQFHIAHEKHGTHLVLIERGGVGIRYDIHDSYIFINDDTINLHGTYRPDGQRNVYHKVYLSGVQTKTQYNANLANYRKYHGGNDPIDLKKA